MSGDRGLRSLDDSAARNRAPASAVDGGGTVLLHASRIADRFAALKAQQRTALIPFVTAGDPTPRRDGAGDARHGGGGGRPHRARGPVLRPDGRRSGESSGPASGALAAGMNFGKVLDIVRGVPLARRGRPPVVLMGYLNPLEGGRLRPRGGARRGGGGSTASSPWTCPRRRGKGSCARWRARGLDPVFLVAPTTSDRTHRENMRGGERVRLLRLPQGG